MSTVKGYHHATLLVRDLDEARRFYGEVLGFKPIERPTLPGLPQGAFFECGALQLHLTVWSTVQIERSPIQLPPPERADVSFEVWDRHLAFQVEDIWAMHERLKVNNAEIVQAPRRLDEASTSGDGITRALLRGWQKMYGMVPLFCRDPSGNLIELVPAMR